MGRLQMKKPEKRAATTGTKMSFLDAAFAERWPTVTDWLTTVRWDDGSTRRASSYKVFVDDGALKVAFHDADEDRTLFVTGDSVEGALDALEMVLKEGNGVWKRWPSSKKRG